MRLIEAAKVIRSKNAGPLQLTIDLMMRDKSAFDAVSASPKVRAPALADLYGVAESTVTVIPYPAALAIKIVIDRPIVAGTPGDRDVYGAQQHAPLLELEL